MNTKIILIAGLFFTSFAFADSGQPTDGLNAGSARPLISVSDVAYFPESRWGQPPVKVTRELVYLQYPDLMPQEDSNLESDDSSTD
jgi:hypothetical protein